MPISLVTTPYGPPASAALHAAVSEAKADDPLAPVSIVVPTNYVGVATRRMLAEGRHGPITGAGDGIVGITLLTLYRVAEMLGAPRLAASGRRPVSTPVIAAAIRTVLSREPGMFAEVAEHPTTEASLVRAHRELSDLDPVHLDVLAQQSPRAGDVVRIHRLTRTGLGNDWYDEHDLMDAAVGALADGSPILPDLGSIVAHLPQRLSRPQARLLTAVADHAPVTVVAGITGAERADATVRTTCGRLGLGAPASDAAPGDARTSRGGAMPAHATRVLSVSDADDEVRTAVRLVVESLREGVPLERMAILYGSDEPYARIVHEQLEAAGITHNGAAVRTLEESLVGRTLLGALSLPDREFRRQDVMALVTSAPIRDADGRLAPAASWERISRRAGVVRGAAEWRARLDRRVKERTAQLEAETDAANEATTDERGSRVDYLRREVRHTAGLRDFVERLAGHLDAGQLPPSWAGKSEWAHRLLDDLLGGDRHRQNWPEHEVDAAEKIERALDRLGGLDEVESAPSLAVFRRTLDMELDSGLGRVGRFGDGLLMGRVPMGLGLEFDRVVVLGLAEGTFPARHREDSLLPDAEREAVDGELALRGTRPDEDHRALLAVLAATTDESVLCFPRGDLRRSTERMPSRFWLDTVQALHGGERLYADDVAGLSHDDAPWLTEIESFVGGLSRLGFPATVQEYDLRVLLDHTRGGGRLSTHPLATSDPAIASGLAMVTARRSSAFTRYDGNLAGLPVPSPTDPDAVTSPTRLEKWAACPHRYFMESVLGMAEPEDPEENLAMAPVDLGNLIHRTLDEFISEVLAAGTAPAPDEPWSDDHHARLAEIGAGTCADFEEQGLTGRALMWRGTRRRIFRDLERFLLEDDKRRAENRLTPMAAELAFGFGDTEPVEFPFADGSALRFRGSADRVDTADDGSVSVVDYKTGSTRAFKGLGEDDPTARGTKLQLPVYALAAQRTFGSTDTAVRADYWFVSDKGNFETIGYPYSLAVFSEFLVALSTITAGVSQGVFPAHPEEPTSWKGWISCPWCDPDGLESHDRYREWTRKRLDPAVRVFTELAEPDEIPDEDADEDTDDG